MATNPSKLMPGDVVDEVRSVLLAASTGKGDKPQFLTAYQILERLPSPTKDVLIAQRGLPGKGSGSSYSAASLVADAAESIHGVEIAFLDCAGISFTVGRNEITSGYATCGLYRLP